jgi:hypothetical protein
MTILFWSVAIVNLLVSLLVVVAMDVFNEEMEPAERKTAIALATFTLINGALLASAATS